MASQVMDNSYPGTPRHQALLAAIVGLYRNDPRILAVSIFGSLTRGNWDQFSDIDLDVVIGDDVQIDVQAELRRLCSSLIAAGEHHPVIIADGDDAGDIVFASLMQLSIRYHTLSTTSPNIVDSMRVLTGSLSQAAISAAGLANRRPGGTTSAGLLDQGVRYIVAVDVAIQRGRLWAAVEMLHRIRGVIMELYVIGHGGDRPLPSFQAGADRELQARLADTLPQFDRTQIQNALELCLEFLERDLAQVTGGQTRLTDAHRLVLAQVRARQAQLKQSK